MSSSDDTRLRVGEQDGHAVRGTDAERDARKCGDHRVGNRKAETTRGRSPELAARAVGGERRVVDHHDIGRVHLVEGRDPRHAQLGPYQREVGCHSARVVTVRTTQVEGTVRPLAYPAEAVGCLLYTS